MYDCTFTRAHMKCSTGTADSKSAGMEYEYVGQKRTQHRKWNSKINSNGGRTTIHSVDSDIFHPRIIHNSLRIMPDCIQPIH